MASVCIVKVLVFSNVTRVNLDYGHHDHYGHHVHYALRKSRSNNTGSSVAMTKTWLDMLEHDSEFLNMNKVYNYW